MIYYISRVHTEGMYHGQTKISHLHLSLLHVGLRCELLKNFKMQCSLHVLGLYQLFLSISGQLVEDK